MEYEFESWSIRKFIDRYNNNQIELNPPYQRNDIWSLPAKKRLIDTIIKEYPLPSFFLYRTEYGKYECVDGQQRFRTILGFHKSMFPTIDNLKITEIDITRFEDYLLPIVVIHDIKEGDNRSMEDFYYRVNMYGSKLNRPEILKSRYFNNPLQNLIERLTESDEFRQLELFTDSRLNRMLDYDFVGELVSLLRNGITEKKLAVDRLFEDKEFSEDVAMEYERQFFDILRVFIRLNKVYPLKETRYKQRNDFYTLFFLVSRNMMLALDTIIYIYKQLVYFNNDIVPSNEDCYAFQEYAFHCVSQSNQKRAREIRFEIISAIVLNKDPNPIKEDSKKHKNENLCDVLYYYNLANDDLVEIEGYYMIDITKLHVLKPEITFFD